MVGLPCSGKTTKAEILEKEYNALLLTPDKWHIKLFGNETHLTDHNDHDKKHTIVEKLLWEIAIRVLSLGVDVILDFGFWAKTERVFFINKSKEMNVNCKIHYMDVSEEELFKRLDERNSKLPEEAFKIPKEYMKEYIKQFQPVGQDELRGIIDDGTVGKWYEFT